jgi:hypothetical protein
MPREEVFKKLAGPRGIFDQGATGHPLGGERYSLPTATGESWSGRTEFLVPARGFCVTVDPLNDALA